MSCNVGPKKNAVYVLIVVSCLVFIYPFLLTPVNDSVRTSMSRPLSKPRVRNPLTSLKKRKEKQEQQEMQQLQQLQQKKKEQEEQTASQIEKEFLNGGGESSGGGATGTGKANNEEEDDIVIPEDTSILNHSLSSSLSSIYGVKELDSLRGSEVRYVCACMYT